MLQATWVLEQLALALAVVGTIELIGWWKSKGYFHLGWPREWGLAPDVLDRCLSPFPRQGGPIKGARHLRCADPISQRQEGAAPEDRHLRCAAEPVPVDPPKVRWTPGTRSGSEPWPWSRR